MEAYYETLIGKSQNQIIQELGEPCLISHTNEWIYIISTNFLGLKKRLYLFFLNDKLKDYMISSLA